MNQTSKTTATKRVLSTTVMATAILLSGSMAQAEPLKTTDTSAAKPASAGASAESSRLDALYYVTTAKGDGKADDTAAIQADIAAMEAAGGGTLLLKSGTYKLTSTIRIRQSSIGIKGAGRSTVFQAVGDYGHVFDCRLDKDPKTWPGLAFVKFKDAHFDTPNDHTSGAVIYARKRPDPYPDVFGFHEIWHLFVIAGGLSHWWMMLRYVLPTP